MGRRSTAVAIDGERFMINGKPTFPGRTYRGWRIDGLLLNSRMANGLFDDLNPLTRPLWAYPDTGEWDPERNTRELIGMLPLYAACGMNALAVNLQGASPLGYYRTDGIKELMSRIRRTAPDATVDRVWDGLAGLGSQPWDSGAFEADGTPRPQWLGRAESLIEAADAGGIVVILGLFYFGQDERIVDEAGVLNAVDSTIEWVLTRGFTNVVIEVNNEADVPRYEHEVLTPPRVHELIQRVQEHSIDGKRLLAGTSFTRRSMPTEEVIGASDFILLHGNGMNDPSELGVRINDVRDSAAFSSKPILFNEDDHFEFDSPLNNFTAALGGYAGWGYFDPGRGAGGGAAYGDYVNGYQNPPINWAINTPRKHGFFKLLAEVTGSAGPPALEA